MAAVRNLMVRAGADFSAITKQASKASQSMRGMQNSVSRSCNAMAKAGAGLKKVFSFAAIAMAAKAVYNFGKEAAAAYDEQVESEVRLAQAMRNTMGARNDEIQSILDLAEAQQKLGVIDGDAQLAGAQELATYLELSSSLEALIPVMNDMAAQQYGFNVTAEQTTTIATMLGKVMNGQVGALSRYGYSFNEAQAQILKFGTEAERAAVLVQVVEQAVGGMNQALANTPTGRMKQLSNTLSDVKKNFGQAVRSLSVLFIPLLNKLASLLAAIATFLNKVAQSFVNVFGDGARAAGKEWQFIPASTVSAIDDATDATDNLTDSTNKAAQAAKKAKEAFQQASFDTLHILQEQEDESDVSNTGANYSPVTSPTTDDYFKEITTAGESEEIAEGFPKLEQFLTKIKDAIEKLKETWSSLKEKFSEIKDKMADIIGKIKDKINDIVETIREKAEKILFVIDAIAGSAILIDWLISLANAAGFAIEAVEALAAGLGVAGLLGAASAVMGTISEFAILIEGVAVPALTACATAVGETAVALGVAGLIGAISGASAAVEGFIGLVGGSMVGALGAAATAAGGLGAAIGLGGAAAGAGMITAGGGGLIAALAGGATATGLLGSSITGVAVPALTAGTGAAAAATGGVAALVGPVAAVVAIVAALGVATYEVIKHWDEIKEVSARAVDGMKQAWNGAADWFKSNVSEPLKEWGKQAWEDVKSAAQTAAEKVRETWNGLRSTLKSTWNDIKTTGSNAWNTIRDTAQQAWDAAYQGAAKAWESAKSGAATAWETVKTTWGQAGNYFNSSVFQPLINAVKNGIEGVKSAFSSMSSIVEGVVQKVKDAISNLQASLPSLQSLRNSVSSAVGTISSKVSSVISAAGSLVTSGLANITSLAVPHLAEGAVIPPNREFTAVLGDQRTGYNIETPEGLLREVVREESGKGAVLTILADILDAVREGKEITVDGYTLGKTVQRSMAMSARASGIA